MGFFVKKKKKKSYWLKLEAADHSVDVSYYSSWPFGLCDLLSATARLLGPQDYLQQGKMNCSWDSCEARRHVNGRFPQLRSTEALREFLTWIKVQNPGFLPHCHLASDIRQVN